MSKKRCRTVLFWFVYLLQVRRQIVYEQGEVYSEMIDCKEEQLQQATDTQVRAHYAIKITELSRKSINKFLDYITSLKTPEGSMPDPLPPGKVCDRRKMNVYCTDHQMAGSCVTMALCSC